MSIDTNTNEIKAETSSVDNLKQEKSELDLLILDITQRESSLYVLLKTLGQLMKQQQAIQQMIERKEEELEPLYTKRAALRESTTNGQ